MEKENFKRAGFSKDENGLKFIPCPRCKKQLELFEKILKCTACDRTYFFDDQKLQDVSFRWEKDGNFDIFQLNK